MTLLNYGRGSYLLLAVLHVNSETKLYAFFMVTQQAFQGEFSLGNSQHTKQSRLSVFFPFYRLEKSGLEKSNDFPKS